MSLIEEDSAHVVMRKEDAVNLLCGMEVPWPRVAEGLAENGYMKNAGDPVNVRYMWDREALQSRPLTELLGAYMKLRNTGKSKIITL